MDALTKYLDGLAPALRAEALARCCASRAWVEAIEQAMPFESDQAALQTAAEVWNNLGPDDWLEALAAHPRIGDVESLRAKYAKTKSWAVGEQAGVDGASQQTLESLAKLNADYENRFGHLFIVCATGKTADEMLGLLQERIGNDPDEELRIAAAEQLKITKLRLEKLAT